MPRTRNNSTNGNRPNPKVTVINAKVTRTSPRTRRPTDPTGRLDIAAKGLAGLAFGMLGGMLGVPDLATRLEPVTNRVIAAYVPKTRIFTASEMRQLAGGGNGPGGKA